MTQPRNPNYCASVIAIKNLIPLDGLDNLRATTIFGNQVLVSKDTAIGDIGLFFPVETQLTSAFLAANNLYRHSELNNNKDVKGFFEDNGRVRCVKLRSHRSEGFFSGLNTLDFCGQYEIPVGTDFDYIGDVEICRKYEVRHLHRKDLKPQLGKSPKKSKLVRNQFRFHLDTEQLGKNLHKFKPDDLISCSLKIHGTSAIFSKVLCNALIPHGPIVNKISSVGQVINNKLSKRQKRFVNLFAKHLRFRQQSIVRYENIFSSRKVIKNEDMGDDGGYYGDNVWAVANKIVAPLLTNGLSIYAELVGFTPTGKPIQKGYDYGCKQEAHQPFDIYVYRVTFTNNEGIVFEFGSNQVIEWCNINNAKPVKLLYYGTVKDLIANYNIDIDKTYDKDGFETKLLETIKDNFVGGSCETCINKVPAEGVVVRREGLMFEAYKCKSPEFLAFETKSLDSGDIGEDL